MIRKNKNGFTLVELLAVIVILAIILVIAVPKVMSVIEDSKKASFESSAKMVAAQVENQYTVAQTLNKPFGETGNCIQEWAGLNENDYASCTYEILEGGTAKVTLEGKNKFKNLWVCEATRSSATATEEECIITCKDNEIGIVEYTPVIPYEIKDYDSCLDYVSKVVLNAGAPQEYINNFIIPICNGEIIETPDDGEVNADKLFNSLMDEMKLFTEQELIENNVIKGSRKNVCIPTSPAECFDFEEGVITGYDETCGTHLVMPSQINGEDVVEIGDRTFMEKGITSVYLPNSIKIIGRFAFENNNISTIEIPSSVDEIKFWAFYDNPLINVKLNNLDVEIDCAFGDSNTIRNHNLPESYVFDSNCEI